jgi:malonyl-CoA O-methyltransferase
MPAESALDKRRILTHFARAAAHYEAAAVLSREVCSRMLERLHLVRLDPVRVLDVGSGTGLAARALAQRYPQAEITRVDLSLPMLQAEHRPAAWAGFLRTLRGGKASAAVCADFERLPIRHGAIDMVVSNLALHWSSVPELALAELHRVLRRGGLLMFTTLGPDTLKELAAAAADERGCAPVHRFVDMHDIGDLLVRAGFADPVMDMEYLTLTYTAIDDLFGDLRATGSMSARAGAAGLRTPRWRAGLAQRYEQFRKDGRLPATFEIVYGHAWKPEQGPRVTADGRAVVRVEMPRSKR